ncbi:MAG TPA: hypothetical protein VIV11_42640 [Kofleriaceae bacterium]
MRVALCCLMLLAACQSKDKPKQTEPTPGSQSQPPGSASQSSSQSSTRSDEPVPDNKHPQLALPPLPDPLPGKRKDLTAVVGTAWRAAIGDVDGDRKRELVVVDSKQLRVVDVTGKQIASAPIAAGIHVLVAHDLDGDGRAEILAGWGQSRDHMTAKARITVHRLKGKELVEEVIVAPETERAEVVAIVPVDKQAVLVAYYDSKFMVTSTTAKRGAQGWQLDKLASIRMATSYARGDLDGDGKPELVVGRIYGDDKGIDGDAFVLAADGTRTKLPTTRGLRSLAIIGGAVYVGDGWHQNYGKYARGLFTRIARAGDSFAAELVENTPGQYGIERIVPASSDGKQLIITLGSHYARAYALVDGKWRGLTIGGAARDIAVGDLDGQPGDEIVIVGDKSEIVDLRGVSFQ